MDQGANTFVVEPKEEEKFYPSKVRKVIQLIMDEKLKTETYDANNIPLLAEELVKRIRSKVRVLSKQQFKLLQERSKVKGAKQLQRIYGILHGIIMHPMPFRMQCEFKQINKETIYGVAIVFGVYYE